jgi:LacI family transcriptional regulator
MATIYDVARIAGVSAKTVSRVLNSDAPVGRETRELVQAAMAQLGYVPSSAARMMRSNKSGLVGLITGAISLPNEPTMPSGLPDLFIVQGIQRAMEASGKTLMIADTGGRNERIPHLIQTFLQHRVEGLIYVAEYHQKVTLPPIPADTPIVLANCFDDIGTPAVLPDDARGQHDLVARLIMAGHRRIAYLTLPAFLVADDLRRQGYRAALSDAGIAFDPALVECCDLGGRADETQLIWDTIDRMLRLPDPPTVLCCGNDKMALRVYGILRSRGLKVPTEISVAGYDNYRVMAETLFPPLTTVELPYAAIGVRAAQRLLSMISEGATPPTKDHASMLISGPVCWRGSVTERAISNITKLNVIREDTK